MPIFNNRRNAGSGAGEQVNIGHEQHYTVSYHKPTGEIHPDSTAPGGRAMGTAMDTKYFSDKKSAKSYGNQITDLGFEVGVQKHDSASQQAGYTQGKPAKLMEAGFTARKFFKGM
jgi:hypothetical protein